MAETHCSAMSSTAGGWDHLLFGSYMPCFDAGQFMIELTCADIPAEDMRKIAHSNAENLLES